MQYDQVQFPNCRRFSFFKKKGTLIMKFYKCCSPDVRTHVYFAKTTTNIRLS